MKNRLLLHCLKANVPVVAVAFNYGNKEIKIAAPYYVPGNIERDIKIMETNYKGVTGFIAANSYKN